MFTLVSTLLVFISSLAVWLVLRIRPPHTVVRKGETDSPLRVAFIHPDLGIGGAEKLIVDSAVGLQSLGHDVTIWTAYHNPNVLDGRDLCFPETRDGTLNVQVHGMSLPLHTKGRFQLVKALIRFFWLSLCVLIENRKNPFDVIIVDQISATIPMLRISKAKILYYCHYPDLLLSKKGGFLKKLYRMPFDYLEEYTTSKSDKILVNSEYTKSIFHSTFKKISTEPGVLYPAVQINEVLQYYPIPENNIIFTLNRFERKKNIGLALEAFALLKNRPEYRSGKLQLVVGGGYNENLDENVSCLQDLQELAAELNIEDRVRFWPSMPSETKDRFLLTCTCLLYTPENEHFGIVPIEAAACEKAVLACNSGGPKESVIHGETGYLLSTDPNEWSKAIIELLDDEDLRKQMGLNARDRAVNVFSLASFSRKLEREIKDLMS